MAKDISEITDYDVMCAAFETSGEELLKRSIQTTADGYVLSYCETGVDPFYGRYFQYGADVRLQADGRGIPCRLFIYKLVYKDCYRQGVRGYVEPNGDKILCYTFDGECPIEDAKREVLCRGKARLKQLGMI